MYNVRVINDFPELEFTEWKFILIVLEREEGDISME